MFKSSRVLRYMISLCDLYFSCISIQAAESRRSKKETKKGISSKAEYDSVAPDMGALCIWFDNKCETPCIIVYSNFSLLHESDLWILVSSSRSYFCAPQEERSYWQVSVLMLIFLFTIAYKKQSNIFSCFHQ